MKHSIDPPNSDKPGPFPTPEPVKSTGGCCGGKSS